MVEAIQEASTVVGAMKLESVPGTAETAASDKFVLFAGDVKPNPTRKWNFRKVAGQGFKQMPFPSPQGWDMPVKMFPVLDGNCLGLLVGCLFGDDDYDNLGTSTEKHRFTWESKPLSFTTWLQYSATRIEKIRLCAVDKLDVTLKQDGDVGLDFAVKGAQVMGGSARVTEFGDTAGHLLDPDTAKQLEGVATRLEIGQPGAAIRETWDSIALSFARNLSFGSPGKPGEHPAGAASPLRVTQGDWAITAKIDFTDMDYEEFLRGFAPTNLAPTAEQISNTFGTIKARLSIYGPALAQVVNGEADYCNAGTSVATFGGSYSHSPTTVVTVGEIEQSNSDVYTMSLGSNMDLTFKAVLAGAKIKIEVPVGAGASLGVTVASPLVTVSVATAGAGVPDSTAAQILAKILDTPTAVAILTPALANGSTGVGKTTALAEQNINTDGFRYRTTEDGVEWSAWSSWEMVTKGAQTLANGITVTFDDDDNGAAGDRFYFSSHYRYMLRFNLPQMAYEDLVKLSYSGNKRTGSMSLSHTSSTAADRPECIIWNGDTAAAYV